MLSEEQFARQLGVCAHLSGLEILPFKGVFENQAGVVQYAVDKGDTSVTFTDWEPKPKKAMQVIENVSVALLSCLLLSIVPVINPSKVMVITFEKLRILRKLYIIFVKNRV